MSQQPRVVISHNRFGGGSALGARGNGPPAPNDLIEILRHLLQELKAQSRSFVHEQATLAGGSSLVQLSFRSANLLALLRAAFQVLVTSTLVDHRKLYVSEGRCAHLEKKHQGTF